MICVGPEDAVDSSRVETQGVELLLQICDIVPGGHVPRRVRDDAVTEIPARLFELTKRGGTDDAVDDDSTILLKRTDSRINVGGESLRIVGLSADTEKPEPLKAVSDLGYCWVSDSLGQVKPRECGELVNHLG
mgnify:CR=1 FL=1